MPKTLIFEGLDNCLKTTLIEKLLKMPLNPGSFQILKYTAPPRGVLSREDWQYETFLNMFKALDFFNKENINSILDRAHIGDFVYGPKYRNTPTEHLDRICSLEEEFLNFSSPEYVKNDLHLFFLYDDLDGLIARNDGMNLSGKEEDVLDELNRFKNIGSFTKIPNLHRINLKEFRKNDDPNDIDIELVISLIVKLSKVF